ncbi:ABC transporter permease [Desertimonas flava]|uniref:ABC transporter permease n=1 Tax=Desertimonas flava TaxID=2064846 RepID=UPI0013C50EB3|nr:ABC transporter permease subunit [Desertimonas flava]
MKVLALRAVTVLSVAAVLLLWQWYGSKPDVFAVAPFTDVARDLWEAISEDGVLNALGLTLLGAGVGYVIAAVLGVAIGFVIAVTSWGRNTLEPLVDAAYATPMSLLIPIIGIYTGLGFRGRVFFIVFWCIFEIIMNTIEGVRGVPDSRYELARSFCANRRTLYGRVVLPSAMPLIVSGLRLGVGRALRGAVTAELLLAAANIGRLTLYASSTFDVPRLLALILLVMLVGLVLMKLAALVERRILRYQHQR